MNFLLKKKHFSLFALIIVILLLTITLLFGCQKKQQSVNTPDYFPTIAWKTSSPEAQGMSSAKLSEMLGYIETRNFQFDNIVIIRNGYIIADANYYPFKREYKHILNSITKSVTSGCIGVAIDKGLIPNTDTKVIDIFKARKISNLDENKKALTLKNLLMMSTGLQWTETGNYSAPDDSLTKLWTTKEPLQYMLDLPMKESPGKSFYYNTGASHILSGMITETTDKSLQDFATQNILGPIGISDIEWGVDNHGLNVGGSRLFMRAEDTAKYGLLFLNNGKWDGKQLISEKWVKESTKKQIDTPNGIAGRSGYGYQWWMNRFGGYSARGFQGQYLFVLPEYNIVAVFTGCLKNQNFFAPEDLMEKYVLSAVQDKTAVQGKTSILENPTAFAALEALCKEIESAPAQKEISKLPAIASKINSLTYIMDNKETFKFNFNKSSEAKMTWLSAGYTYNLTIGMDGVFRENDMDGLFWPGMIGKAAFRGSWTSADTFELEFIPLEGTTPQMMSFTFKENELHLVTTDNVNKVVIGDFTGKTSK